MTSSYFNWSLLFHEIKIEKRFANKIKKKKKKKTINTMRAFYKTYVLGARKRRLLVNGRRLKTEKKMVSKIFGYVWTELFSNFIFLLTKIQQKNAQNTRTLILCLHWNTAYEQGETTWQSSLSEKWPFQDFEFGCLAQKCCAWRKETYLNKKEEVNFQIK